MDKAPIESTLLQELTARIVSAHVSGNSVPPNAIAEMVRNVYGALASLGAEAAPEKQERPEPAVPVKRSIQRDHLVCLEDGAKVTMLKRYLQTRYGLTPAAYREKWGLPADYPMTAPAYAERRSALAKEFGLGRARKADVEVEAQAEPKPEPVPRAHEPDEAASHTAESVFANFRPASAEPDRPSMPARRAKRKPFAEEAMHKGRAKRT